MVMSDALLIRFPHQLKSSRSSEPKPNSEPIWPSDFSATASPVNSKSSTCDTTMPRRILPVPCSSTLALPMTVLSKAQRHHIAPSIRDLTHPCSAIALDNLSHHSRGASAKPKMPFKTRHSWPSFNGKEGDVAGLVFFRYNSRSRYGSPFKKAALTSAEMMDHHVWNAATQNKKCCANLEPVGASRRKEPSKLDRSR